MRLRKLFEILLSCLILHSLFIAQTQTNFEQIDSLILISANDVAKGMDLATKYSLNFIGSTDYKVLESKLIGHLQNNGISLVEEDNKSPILNYNFDEAKIKYGEVYRDGLFGTYIVEREVKIYGSYFITENGRYEESRNIEYALNDSVLYSDLSALENIGYSFTTAEIPEEPFFSSTLEPVIAIGSAAVAIYLFFNIRSK